MGTVIWGSILSAFLILLILINWFYQRQLREKLDLINALQESLNDLQAKLKEKERRESFRVKLLEQECTFEIIDFDDKLLEQLKHRQGKGEIRDISRTGLKLICDYDLPVRKHIFLQLYFLLQDEEFSFKGKIVRKEELMNDIIYGIEFIEADSTEQQRLYQVIQKLEIERRKKTK
ncbi:PilZ domain-containing protein [Bacillota bacterium Lsc_1132]